MTFSTLQVAADEVAPPTDEQGRIHHEAWVYRCTPKFFCKKNLIYRHISIYDNNHIGRQQPAISVHCPRSPFQMYTQICLVQQQLAAGHACTHEILTQQTAGSVFASSHGRGGSTILCRTPMASHNQASMSVVAAAAAVVEAGRGACQCKMAPT